MNKFQAPTNRREYRPAGITPQFLETMEDEPDYSDEEDLTATERARSALQRQSRDEDEEVRKSHHIASSGRRKSLLSTLLP